MTGGVSSGAGTVQTLKPSGHDGDSPPVPGGERRGSRFVWASDPVDLRLCRNWGSSKPWAGTTPFVFCLYVDWEAGEEGEAS